MELEALVKQRTRELRGATTGYAAAVEALAEEIYRTGRGKETRLGEMGATVASIAARFGGGGGGPLFEKTKKGKARAIAAIRTQISPWVSDVYEAEPTE